MIIGPCSLGFVLTRSSSNITVHLAFHANFGRKVNVERVTSALTYMNSGGVVQYLRCRILSRAQWGIIGSFISERPVSSVILHSDRRLLALSRL